MKLDKGTLFKRIKGKYRYHLGKWKTAPLYARLRKQYLKEHALEEYFLEKNGVEIGGPSGIFSANGILPIYSLVKSLDGCNFTTHTVWEGSIEDGKYNYQNGKSGHQYICEGSSLHFCEDARYDFLLSSHSLEHHANVLGTLKEWKRVVKPGGLLLIVVPEKKYTFDHKRQYTDFEHFIEDERKGVDEHDLTHLDEILQLHDLSRDPGADDPEFFKNRSLQNFEHRCVHHHVFNFDNLGRIAAYMGLEVLASQFVPPYHNIIFLRKPARI